MNARTIQPGRFSSVTLCVVLTFTGCRSAGPAVPVAHIDPGTQSPSATLAAIRTDNRNSVQNEFSDAKPKSIATKLKTETKFDRPVTANDQPSRVANGMASLPNDLPPIDLVSFATPPAEDVNPDTRSPSDILLANFVVGPDESTDVSELEFAAAQDENNQSDELAELIDSPSTTESIDAPSGSQPDNEGEPEVTPAGISDDVADENTDATIDSKTENNADEFDYKYDTVTLGESQHPIDLPAALRLAGADNWSVRLAHERIHEAQADLAEAEAMWLPSINLGLGYTQHEGKIQATDGSVIDVSRNALFLGGASVNQNAPTTGGSGGPARMFVDLSIADALYEPLARCQRVNAAKARQNTVFNETLTSVALAYYDLVGSQGRLSLENQNIKDANSVLELTKAFVAAGKAPRSEVDRVSVAAGIREQSAIRAELAIKRASAELARLLQLDFRQMPSGFVLVSNDSTPTPVEWVNQSADLQTLIAQGLGVRPEVHELQASVAEFDSRVVAEQVRPFIPHLHLGLSGGLFSGGTGDNLSDTGGRSDVDAVLVWQTKNLGYGNRAMLAQRLSQQRQAVFRSHQVEDLIASEITQAWQAVGAQRESIQLAEQNIKQAVEVYESNLLRIRGLEGLPLEALQALQALATARVAWLEAVIRYNKAQVLLLKAIGRPIDGSAQPVTDSNPETLTQPAMNVDELADATSVPDIPRAD